MGVGDVCPYCGADNRKVKLRVKRTIHNQQLAGGLGAYPVTTALVGANVLLFLLSMALGGVHAGHGMELLSVDSDVLLRLGAHFSPAIALGEWWRLFTAIFLHGGIVHVFFNTYILWVAGRHVEAEFGPRLMFLIYMLAGVLGFVGSYFAGIAFSVGASGAISGLLGALLVRRWLVDGNLRNPITMWVIQLIVLTAIFGLVVSQVNNVAHLVGFLSGAGLSLLLTKVRLSKAGAIALMVVTTALGLGTLVSFGEMAFSLTRASGEEVVQAARCSDKALAALVDEGRGVAPGLAKVALDCFEDLPGIASEADEGVEAMKRGLSVGAAAHEDSDLSAEQEAARAVLDGHARFVHWLNANYARYGLSRG